MQWDNTLTGINKRLMLAYKTFDLELNDCETLLSQNILYWVESAVFFNTMVNIHKHIFIYPSLSLDLSLDIELFLIYNIE